MLWSEKSNGRYSQSKIKTISSHMLCISKKLTGVFITQMANLNSKPNWQSCCLPDQQYARLVWDLSCYNSSGWKYHFQKVNRIPIIKVNRSGTRYAFHPPTTPAPKLTNKQTIHSLWPIFRLVSQVKDPGGESGKSQNRKNKFGCELHREASGFVRQNDVIGWGGGGLWSQTQGWNPVLSLRRNIWTHWASFSVQ